MHQHFTSLHTPRQYGQQKEEDLQSAPLCIHWVHAIAHQGPPSARRSHASDALGKKTRQQSIEIAAISLCARDTFLVICYKIFHSEATPGWYLIRLKGD